MNIEDLRLIVWQPKGDDSGGFWEESIPTWQQLIDMLGFIKQESQVTTEVYAPGDTYQAIEGRQVPETFRSGTKMQRWVSEWVRVDAALGDGE